MTATLWATSDLHVGHAGNAEVLQRLQPNDPGDWLLVAGDIAEHAADIITVLRMLAARYARVVWSPGNHELWTPPNDAVQLRGVARYEYLIEQARALGVSTPEDPYPIWDGVDGQITVVPMFLLYDYSFRPRGALTKEQGLHVAYEAGVVCTDERFLHPDPFASLEEWCAHRVAYTQARLQACDPALPSVLMNHWPLLRAPTEILRYPSFAQWCGTDRSADWHLRYRAQVVVYGHLHIPRTNFYDGVRFEEVSLGYPREWSSRPWDPVVPRRILPAW